MEFREQCPEIAQTELWRLLMMAACCHDCGMSVSESQRAELSEELEEEKDRGFTGDWLAYFKKYPGDEVAYSRTRTLSEQILRRYVREYHARRVEEQLPSNWPRALTDRGIFRDRLVRLCRSHGEELTESLNSGNTDFDLNLCAVLLRLADLLDYDAGRAPEALFLHLGLDHPDTPEQKRSREEWKKNAAGGFGEIREGGILYRAAFDSPQTEHEVREYLDWVRRELTVCRDFLSRYAGRWQDLKLPWRVTEDVTRTGYEAGDFHLTMDQDRVLELLAGKNLYDNPGVFVRELLQNAIDAVLARRRLDPNFGENAGRVVVRTWTDDEGYAWFRMEDDGIGMDEHIIHSYFLKVGRSYYTSEEYQAAELHAVRDTGFKPTSRFGIGILSCFMSDPDRNVVEVSTRRYTLDPTRPNPVYRLNVTGLHGYYYLTEATRANRGQPMHRPPVEYGPELSEAKDSYRRGVGTTICVGLNLYRLVGVDSFKELLDQYVVFPEVRVDYYGPEVSGRYTYPTQLELMDAVHKLNEGMVGMEPVPHVHPFTDEMMKELEAQLSPVEWTERPALILRYYPLDWMSGSGNLSGTAITVDVRGSATSRDALRFDGKVYHTDCFLELERDDDSREDDSKVKIQCMFKTTGDMDDLHTSRKYGPVIIRNMLSLMDSVEKNVFQFNSTLLNRLKRNFYEGIHCTAYNGVLADSSAYFDFYGLHGNLLWSTLILLRGRGYPDVDLSRNYITSFPLESACDVAFTFHFLPEKRMPNYADNTVFVLFPEKNYRDVLDRYPKWNDLLRYDGYSLLELEDKIKIDSRVEISDFRISPYDLLCLAAMKRRFRVCKDFESYSVPFLLIGTSDIPTGFPAPLFFYPDNNNTALGTGGEYINYYNIDHRFSRWLIARQKQLQEQVPGIYDGIIRTMVLGEDEKKIQSELNSALSRLEHFPGNPFGVTAELYIQDGELVGH